MTKHDNDDNNHNSRSIIFTTIISLWLILLPIYSFVSGLTHFKAKCDHNLSLYLTINASCTLVFYLLAFIAYLSFLGSSDATTTQQQRQQSTQFYITLLLIPHTLCTFWGTILWSGSQHCDVGLISATTRAIIGNWLYPVVYLALIMLRPAYDRFSTRQQMRVVKQYKTH